ncbi:MAG: hypothetical protein RIS47_2014 [Bacteroidota bacterium]|jgi:thiol-disulfide isomerase/thioredoxin
MKKYFFVLVLSLLVSGLKAQKVEAIKLPQLLDMIEASDSLVIFNFWATWCRPCVAELPHFAEVANEQKTKVHIVLISLDFASEMGTKLQPFLQRKNFGLDCYLLDETNYDSWIDKISPTWDGGIPASLVVDKSQNLYEFHAGELSKTELEAIILKYSKP